MAISLTNTGYNNTISTLLPIDHLNNPPPARDRDQWTDVPKSDPSTNSKLTELVASKFRTQTNGPSSFDPKPTPHQKDVMNQFFKKEFAFENWEGNEYCDPNDAKARALEALEKIQKQLGRPLTDDEIKQLSTDIMYGIYTDCEDYSTRGTPATPFDDVVQQIINKWTHRPSDPFPISDEQKKMVEASASSYVAAGGDTVGDHLKDLFYKMVDDLVTELQDKIGRPLTNDELHKLVGEAADAIIDNDVYGQNKGLLGVKDEMLKKWAAKLGAA